MMIKKAYDKVKSDYTHIEDVGGESGLSEKVFLLCITELAKQGTIELLPGTQLWNDEKQGYQVNDETFYGMQWVKDTPEKETAPTAFEKLFDRLSEITAIMESTDKKTAVGIIRSEFPEFADMTDNTIKTNITSFPFLCKVTSESDGIKQQLNTVKKDKDGCLNELDTIKQKLNIVLNNLQTTEQQLIEKDKEMTELNNQLNSAMDTDKIATFIQETEQRFDELNNRIKQLESDKQKDKQIKHTIKQRGLNNVGKWNVVESGGYYRAFRNIDGKNVGVYIGKEFSEDKAKEKITAKGHPID